MKYTVIIPVYNSEKSIGALIEKICDFFKSKNLEFEIVCVSDASTDGSWKIVEEKINIYPNQIVGIELIKNYGQHMAIFCGIQHSKGDYIITIDDDLQNEPQEIQKLIEKSQEGYELVFGKYIIKEHSFLRNLGSKIFNKIISIIFNAPENIYVSNFRIISKKLAERITQSKISYPNITGLLFEHTKSISNIEVEHKKRVFGKSNYSSIKILKLIFELLFNFSVYPMRFFSIVGIVISTCVFLVGIYFLYKSLVYGNSIEGWASLVVILSFTSALNLLILFMLSEYLIRILRSTTASKIYFINKIIDKKSK